MNKIAIIYVSVHNKNTEKLVLRATENLENIDIFDIGKSKTVDLSKYDILGIASGIYWSDFHKLIYEFLKTNNIPEKVFLTYTCGSGLRIYDKKIRKVLESKNKEYIGTYVCKGKDTFSFLKIFGGLAKTRPNENDINNFKGFILNLK